MVARCAGGIAVEGRDLAAGLDPLYIWADFIVLRAAVCSGSGAFGGAGATQKELGARFARWMPFGPGGGGA